MVRVTLLSPRDQAITLEVPSPIASARVVTGPGAVGDAGRADARTVTLPAGRSVTLELELRPGD